MKQTTLAAPVSTKGIGLHTAVPVTVSLMPAPPDTGYVFRRTDLGGFESRQPSNPSRIAVTPRR